MTFNQDAIIQYKTGTFTGTSGNATLDTGTTAGNAVVVIIGLLGDNTNAFWVNSLPGGFSFIGGDVDSTGVWSDVGAYMHPSIGAGATSWTFGLGASQTVIWCAMEITGADLGWSSGDLPYKQTTSSSTGTAAAATWSGWTSTSQTFEGFAVVAFMAVSEDATVPTFTGFDQGFNEFTEQGASTSPKACALGVATKQMMSVGQAGAWGTTSINTFASAVVMVFTGLDSKHAPEIANCFGAELGTATTLTNATAFDGVKAPFNGVTGTPAVTTSTPRSGSYCLELSSTAAAEHVTNIDTAGPPTGNIGITGNHATVWVSRIHVYFPTSLPTPDTPIYSLESGSLANGVVLRYVTASQKLGLKVGSGSEVLSDTTVAANVWIGVDIFYDPQTTTHTCRWAVDYDATPGDLVDSVPQTTASNTGMTAGTVTTERFGWTTAATATVRYDDLVGSRNRKCYPIGDVEIRPLKVDPAGTPTLTGTVGNFRTFTNNGTLTAWTAVNTRNVLSEVPPIIGASSDGLTQITAASGDYVEVPMETFTCAPDYSPLAARWYMAGWAASATAAFIRFKAQDGVGTFPTMGADVDSQFDSSTMVWTTFMHNTNFYGDGSYPMTQAKVDGLAMQVGYSNDATPDVGVHNILCELVIQPALVYGIAEADGCTVYVRQDRNSGAVVSWLVTTPVERGATLTYTISGVEGSQYVPANTTGEKIVGATDIATVTAMGLYPDGPA